MSRLVCLNEIHGLVDVQIECMLVVASTYCCLKKSSKYLGQNHQKIQEAAETTMQTWCNIHESALISIFSDQRDVPDFMEDLAKSTF